MPPAASQVTVWVSPPLAVYVNWPPSSSQTPSVVGEVAAFQMQAAPPFALSHLLSVAPSAPSSQSLSSLARSPLSQNIERALTTPVRGDACRMPGVETPQRMHALIAARRGSAVLQWRARMRALVTVQP